HWGRHFRWRAAEMVKWRNVIGWTAISIGALLLLVIVAAFTLLKSPAFHKYLLARIEQAAGQSTGARVEIQNFQVHIKTLTADVYGLTVHGSEAEGEKPLLQVEHAAVGIKIVSLLKRKFNLSELIVERPVVNLVVDKGGRSNLPQPPASQKKSSNTNV